MDLSNCQKFSYSVGHVLNDLCASMWFSYLLVYFHKVLEFTNSMAGYLLLIGQIADGLATPFVGFESDNITFSCVYGRRKSWHLMGCICVTLTFPLLFMHCITCNENTPIYAQFIYYAPLVVIFQFGWASTQINHLALIPDLTNNDGDKVTLNALRYAFTVFSSVLVYGIAWIILDMPNESNNEHGLSPQDAVSFRNLVLSVVSIGVVFCAIFHIGLKEPPRRRRSRSRTNFSISGMPANSSLNNESFERIAQKKGEESSETTCLLPKPSEGVITCQSTLHWYEWFKKPAFYQITLLYMCTRLVVNISQVYVPMFLTDTLLMHKKYIAIVPLVIYVSSFLAALLVRPISKRVVQELIYLGGAAFVISSCVWAYFMPEHSMQIFGLAILLGIGNSIILVMSLSMTAKLIGKETRTGGFVYGAMSLTDKLSNGIAIVAIQNLNPCSCNCPKCSTYFRAILSYGIGSIMVVAVVILVLSYLCKKPEESGDDDVAQ